MSPDAIDSLSQAVQGIRQERPLPDDWSGDLEIVDDNDNLAGEIEDELFADDDSERLTETLERLPDLADVEAEIADAPYSTESIESVTAGDLADTLGSGFPGALSGTSITGGSGRTGRPTADA